MRDLSTGWQMWSFLHMGGPSISNKAWREVTQRKQINSKIGTKMVSLHRLPLCFHTPTIDAHDGVFVVGF
jgi:hypothetical protein